MLTPRIYKYGIYIEPAAHGQFASLTHLRLTTFPVKGLPKLDNGRKHIEFLRNIYLRCRPWIEETYMNLDHGLKLAKEALDLTESTLMRITDPDKRELIQKNAEMTYRLVDANNKYVKAMISYFQYLESKTNQDKRKLSESSKELEKSMDEFRKVKGFVYRLDGMEQLQINIGRALEDVEKENAVLDNSPNDREMVDIINNQQDKYKAVLDEYKEEAVKLLSWKGRIDGRDLLKIRGDKSEIEHLRYDPIQEITEKTLRLYENACCVHERVFLCELLFQKSNMTKSFLKGFSQ